MKKIKIKHKRILVIVVSVMALIISGAVVYYSLYVKDRGISELIVGEWEDNNGINSIFNDDMTMVYMDSGDLEIKGEYDLLTDSIMIWTLHRVYIPNDIIVWKYTIENKNKITIEEMYYNEFNELVSYDNPGLILTRRK